MERAARKLRVLLVDDEAFILNAMCRRLESHWVVVAGTYENSREQRFVELCLKNRYPRSTYR